MALDLLKFISKPALNRSLAEALTDGKWIEDIKGKLSIPALMQFCELWEKVGRVILTLDQQDQFIWKLTPNGTCSKKWNLLQEISLSYIVACSMAICRVLVQKKYSQPTPKSPSESALDNRQTSSTWSATSSSLPIVCSRARNNPSPHDHPEVKDINYLR
jgi:hypothetical protein